MPEVINSVTTGSGLLHEVFQDTLKQSLQSAGFHVYEYDQSSGRFKSNVDGQDLGMEVRFPRMSYIYDYGTGGDNTFIHGNMVVDWSEGSDLVPIFYNMNFTNYRRLYLIRLSGGEVSSSLYNEFRFYYYPSDRSYSQNEILLMNPVPGYLIVYALGRTTNPVTYYYQDFVMLFSYDLTNNSISERSRIKATIESNDGWDFFGFDGVPADKQGHFVSKVYKYEDSTYVRYTVFTFYHRNGGELYINTITFNKTNNSISYNRKLVHQGLYTTFKDQFYPPGGDSTWYWSPYTSVKTDDYHAGVQVYLRDALSAVDSNTVSGNLIFAFKKLPPNVYDVALELIPFTATLDFSTYENTTFSLDLQNKVVYAPFNMRTIFKDAYVLQGQNTIEVPRSSSYAPPTDYQKKIERVNLITPNTNFLVVTSDIDQGGRLKVSSVLSSGIPAEVERNLGLYSHPATFFVNYEVTESGSYFTGFSSIEPWGVKGPFLISKYHRNVFVLTRVIPTKKGKFNENHHVYILTLNNPLPKNVVWGSDLSQRVTQPYIAELTLGGLKVFGVDRSNNDPSKTVFTNLGKLYLTSFVQTNFHDSGYFTPFFIVMARDGDGEWLDSGTLYVGLDTYDPHNPSDTWRKIFAVNGVVSAVRTYHDNYDYPHQVNSTISLVLKLVISPQNGAMSLIGIQGQNRLRFLNLVVLDDSHLSSHPEVFLPFGNLSLWITTMDKALAPYAQVYYYQGGYTNDIFYPHYNKHYKWYNLERTYPTPNRPVVAYDQVDERVSHNFMFYGSKVKTPPSVDLASATVFLNPGFSGLFGFTPKILLVPKEPLSLIRAVDKSNTLVDGDYVILEDKSDPSNPVTMKYVVINFSDRSTYIRPYNNETSTKRLLECLLVEVL